MTAPPLFTPVLPPGSSPARAMQGEDASDGAGLFALLLAGAQTGQTDVGQGTDLASLTPAHAAAVADDCACPLGVLRAPAMQREGLTYGGIGVEAPGTTAAGGVLPPTLTVVAQVGPGQGSPSPQLAPADPPTASPVAALAQNPERVRTPTAPKSGLDDPGPGPKALSAAATPPPRAVAPAAGIPVPSGPSETAGAPPLPAVAAPAAPAAEARVPFPPRGWSLQTGAPGAATDMPLARPSGSPSAAAGDRSIARAVSEVGRPHPVLLAATSGSPGPGAGQPAADEKVSHEPPMDAPEGAITRSEQVAAEPARAAAPGRSAPPPPMLQIGMQIARAAPARIDRIFVQLEPASLGRVEVRLEFHRDHQVSAAIAAERPDTLDALQRDARMLERSLHQAGLRLDSDGLTFSLKREQAHEQAREERWPAPPASEFGDQPLLTAHGRESAPVQWFRGLRTLDIRV